MAEGIDDWTNDIHCGDAVETLEQLPESSVHCCMTSPPYYGLRDYGADGQIGLEESLDEYIANIVEVGNALRRVLRDDGSWWLNLGDSYATARGNHTTGNGVGGAPDSDYLSDRSEKSLGHKNKMLVPHRVAIALQESGWIVRNDVTWVKPNPMPSSVKDRLNTTTEQVFHLVPNPDYWYDLDAIREPYAESYQRRAEQGYDHKHGAAAESWGDGDHGHAANHNVGGILDETGEYGDHMNPGGKNPGDVFEVTTKPFPDAHFAVYPPELCEKPIKATCPPKVCADCGAPYEREVEVGDEWRESGKVNPHADDGQQHASENQTGSASRLYRDHGGGGFDKSSRIFKGWTQTCDCDTDATESGIVLDPFAGAGTTCLIAKRLGRRFIGIDLNPEYVALAQRRVGLTVDDPSLLPETDDAQTGLEQFTAMTDGGE